MITKFFNYFTKFELFLWSFSSVFIIVSFIIFDRSNYLTLISSLIGTTSLIFIAKGNPFGQFLMVLFSIFYGIISFSFAYYGEMITYLGMNLPMSLFALISWLRNPYNGNKSEVAVSKIRLKELIIIFFVSIAVTYMFYYILFALNTTNLIPSTISITTSFLGAYLMARRSPYFAVVYISNDIVLIVLWILASVYDSSYISVVICFIIFMINDSYSFYNWKKTQKRQAIK
ncbi:MAG: nicotinamide riboside transporter PnuC [Clostridia bacterium]|nr:nicotinamide riboside transporter PnuC [Clostridia bacterium]